jgi:hypothetical protein
LLAGDGRELAEIPGVLLRCRISNSVRTPVADCPAFQNASREEMMQMAKTDLPILELRRIEANIIKPIYQEMVSQFGHE